MLGSAPGTDLLNEWVAAVNDGASLQDIADHIAASDAFTTTYPTFLTNAEFAESFLENLMGSEEVPAALVTAAEGIVTGLLNDGMTRGALAIAVFTALYEIHDQGEAHAAYADLGMVANGLFNKIDVAEYYTVDLRQANPNSRVLRDVNSEMGLDDIQDSIGDYLDPPDPILLTSQRDNVVGTAANDLIVAEPDSRGEDTLDPFDVIDGGPGHDSLEVYASGTTDIEIDTNGADVTNVERVYLSTRGAIDVDLTGWEGLETVELGRFGSDANVSVTVDGASVSSAREFGGETAMISGAAGMVSLEAGKDTAVTVGSGAHTTGVSVEGGASVTVHNGAGGQSMSVTGVYLDGVQRALGTDEKRGTGQEPVPVTVSATNGTDTASATQTQYGTNVGGTFTPIPDSADNPTTTYYMAANQDINGADVDGTGLDDGQVVVTTDAMMAAMRDMEGAMDMPSVHIHSNALEHISLSDTDAIVAAVNANEDAESLMVTVDGFGGGKGRVSAKLCVTDGSDGHKSSVPNVSINVAGDSDFYLGANATKTVSVSGDGDVDLKITMFDTSVASGTVESLTFSGGGKVTTDVAGTAKLETIDGSASSGGSNIKGVHDAVTMVHGGSGADAVTVAGFADGGLTANLGAGNDMFTSAGGNGKSRVDGGEGVDVLHLTGSSVTHKVDGKDVSIYSNFEALEVGGTGADGAEHDISLLGVHAVSVSASTGRMELNNMADGMGLTVNGMAGMGTMTTVVHNMMPRDAGDARYSGVLDVTLTANGGKDDTAMMGTGAAMLTLTADEEIETLNVASNANPAGEAGAATYQNSLVLSGEDDNDGLAIDSSVEAINVSGSARLMIGLTNSANSNSSGQFENLKLINAMENSGGVTFSAVVDAEGTLNAMTQDLEMVGGSGKDMFTGGAGEDELSGGGGVDTLNGGDGDDTITGGAAGDMMTGGAGTNTFKIGAADSRLVFDAKGNMSGYDTITDFGGGTNNVISVGKALFDTLRGTINNNDATINGTDNDDAAGATGDEEDTTLDTLKAFLDTFKEGDGVFQTRGTPVAGAINDQGELISHSITTVTQTYWARRPVADNPETTDVDETFAGESATRKWILIDVDGDGHFDAATDMAIALTDSGTGFDNNDIMM